jgi:hypothetical protein
VGIVAIEDRTVAIGISGKLGLVGEETVDEQNVIKMELWKVRGYRFRLESSVIKNRIWLIK